MNPPSSLSSANLIAVAFPNGNRARALRVPASADGAAMAVALDLPLAPAVLLISAGAADLPPVSLDKLRALLAEGVGRGVARESIAVVDGGTQLGAFRWVGEGVAALGGGAPLVGVCPAALVTWPGGPAGAGRVPLEPNHTHFVLTPGDRWGAETPTMFKLAAALSQRGPSLALLISGGSIAQEEVLRNIRQGRDVVVIRGSGRLADQIARARDPGDRGESTKLTAIASNPRVTLLDMTCAPAELAGLIQRKLSGGHRG
jgi:hypothetical protein